MEKNNKVTVIAFYLPQYYPVKENDEWYGKGFTEWTNVGKAKPQFRGHYQPRVPADLGYYDLRIPEVRKAQAELALEAGVSAFSYYHYWFGNGKQLLEMPLAEVVKSGEPDFPFCITWANHSWYKKTWDPHKSILDKEILIKQEYPGEKDIEDHFYSLLDTFRDKRYYKVQGKLLFILYKVETITNLDLFKDVWQMLAKKNNLPGFFFVSYADDIDKIKAESHTRCDATILSLKTNALSVGGNSKTRKLFRAILGLISEKLGLPLQVVSYSKIIDNLAKPIFMQERIYPVIIPNWDYTPRRGNGGLIIHNSNPALFKKHVKQVLSLIKNKNEENKIVFLKSWNEWGEGNYMEPDLKFGKGYIYALKEALDEDLRM